MSEWRPGARRAAVMSALLVLVGLALTLGFAFLDSRPDLLGGSSEDDALQSATARLAARDAAPGPRPFPLGMLILSLGATLVAGALPWGVLGLARLLGRGTSRDEA